MAFLSPLLTVVALAVTPALWLIAFASRRRLFPASWDAQQQAGERGGVVDGAVTGVRVVKGFGQEEQEIEHVEGASTALYASRLRAVRLTARYNPALQAIPTLGQVGVARAGRLARASRGRSRSAPSSRSPRTWPRWSARSGSWPG